MTVLPIVGRELRVASRRRGTYWTRFSAALLAIVLGSWAWAMFLKRPAHETGLAIFIALSIIAYIYSLIAGALATADCLSEEKREGTLGLLFLTDLKGYDVVLGKLAASSLGSIYGLLAIFPVMGVPLLLGGVAPAEFWRVVLVCANNLFFSLALGMFCSAICKDERKAIGLTMSTIILLTAAWPGVVAWIASEIRPDNVLYELFREHPEPLFALSPGFACVFAFDIPYKAKIVGEPMNWFHLSLAMTHAISWAALVLATLIVPRIWQDKAASRAASRRQETWKRVSLGGEDMRRAFRRRLLDINPFYWLASRERFKVALVWMWLGAGALLWLVGLVREKRHWLDESIYVMTAFLAHSSLKAWVAMEASRRIGNDRRSGALELLLSTPLRVKEILYGQWLALLRQFGAAAVLICAVDLIFVALGLSRVHGSNDKELWVAMWLAGILIFVLDLFTIPPLTIWLSLTGRKATRAGTSALVIICCVPWFMLGVFGAFMALMNEVFGVEFFNNGNELGWILIGVWFLTSLLLDIILGNWARRNLHEKFRLVATQRLETKAGFWKRMFGRAG
jgi:ABC-type transport system involved in multi-copper enzyme maturation permease subunit